MKLLYIIDLFNIYPMWDFKLLVWVSTLASDNDFWYQYCQYQ